MSAFKVTILAADHTFLDAMCESVVIPTSKGQYGILAHHSNAIAAVSPGMLKYRVVGEEEKIAAVSEGLIKVENNEVLVLVDSAEKPEEIDAIRAKNAADAAKEAMLHKKSIREYRGAQADLARAIARLRIKRTFTGGESDR